MNSSMKLLVRAGAVGGVAVASYFLTRENHKHGSLFSAVKVAGDGPVSHSSPPPPSAWAKWDWNWDKREPENLVKPSKLEAVDSPDGKKKLLEEYTPTASRNIILVRHGQYVMDAPDESMVLTQLGRKEAEETGKRLAQLGIKWDRIVYSTMVRATETGKIILGHVTSPDVRADSLIEEGRPCAPEPPVSHYTPVAKELLMDGARIEAGFRRHFHRAEPKQKEDSTELLVCHANVIRYFVCRALQFPPEAWLRISLANCSITWLIIRPSGRVVIKQLGDSGHLPPDLITFT